MATAFWVREPGRQPVIIIKWRDPAGQWRKKRATGCRTLEHAQRDADDLERQAERQRLGLDPVPQAQGVTFGALFDWWWTRYGSRGRSYSKDDFHAFLVQRLEPLQDFLLLPALGGEFADKLDRLLDAARAADGRPLAAQTMNHIRSAAFRAFECARDPKHHKWTGENPVRWVKRRKVPKSAKMGRVLRREEVLPLLAGFHEPSLVSPWRWIAASMIYAGLRPGEAFGLHKSDVDKGTWNLIVQRSWSNPRPKDDDPRTVPIVRELRPHLLAAMQASPNHLVFPRPDGKPYDPTVRFNLGDHLSRALTKAGLVVGYDHTCRRCKAKMPRATWWSGHPRMTRRWPPWQT